MAIILGVSRINHILTLIACLTICGCGKLSETVHDEMAGMNGSFEVSRDGLPVNWLVYSPRTIPTGDYDLIFDTDEHKDGKQSLRFLVRDCSSDGGWRSPGLAQEIEAIPGEMYRISFWAKNDGAEFRVKIGAVSAFEGQTETIVSSKEGLETWKLFEYEYEMPAEFNRIRFELNILGPGSFWIDDLRITPKSAEGV